MKSSHHRSLQKVNGRESQSMVFRAAFQSVLRLLALWTVMAGVGDDNAQPAFLTNGLVAFYPFNGDSKDASGHNLNAQLFNAANLVAAPDRFNVPNSAFEFRQKMNDIEPIIWGQGINLAGKSLTLSYWIKGDFTKSGLGMAGVKLGTIPPGTPNPGGSAGKHLHAFVNYVYQGIIRFSFFSDDFDLPVNVLPGDQWNQMVFVYDKDAAVKIIAINGVVESTKSAARGFSGNDIFTILNPGSGYTSAPTIRIASPPFAPSVSIEVSKVAVRLKVVQGRRYQLESSATLQDWAPVGESFVAELEDLEEEFDVRSTGAYFRIRQVP